MASIHSAMLNKLAKRGLEMVSPAQDGQTEAYIADLQVQAQRYKENGDGLAPLQISIIFVTFVLAFIMYSSIKYTVGEVLASLAMIEQPQTTTIIRAKTSEYDDKPDAPLEKDRLLAEEVVVVKEKPITTNFRKAIRHLVSVGGIKGRWRGLAIGTVYHSIQAIMFHIWGGLFELTPIYPEVAFVLTSALSTVLLARLHMTWTHIMISAPSDLPWYRRVPSGRAYWRVLALPSLFFVLSQLTTLMLPIMVFVSFGKLPSSITTGVHSHADCKHATIRVLATLASAAFVGLGVLLPASVTLTRVEASLLPENFETIVPFDRTLGGAAVSLVSVDHASCRALYDGAWRSFNMASRIRMIVFYVKYFAVLTAVVVISAIALAAEVKFFSGSRIGAFVHSSYAQMQLAGLGQQ